MRSRPLSAGAACLFTQRSRSVHPRLWLAVCDDWMKSMCNFRNAVDLSGCFHTTRPHELTESTKRAAFRLGWILPLRLHLPVA